MELKVIKPFSCQLFFSILSLRFFLSSLILSSETVFELSLHSFSPDDIISVGEGKQKH
jgi:hypothetical protein